MKPKLLHSKLLAKSWLVNFYEDTLQYESTSKPFTIARIKLPDIALTLGEKEDGKMALVRQYRKRCESFLLGIPRRLH
jgi:hypothetical protein